MSQQINARVAVVGFDISKNSFHIVGQDGRGEIVLRQPRFPIYPEERTFISFQLALRAPWLR